MALRDDHLPAVCARTGKTVHIPAARIDTLEPTKTKHDRAVTDIVLMDGGERIPVRDTIESINEKLAELAKRTKKKT